jgi:hypothetical protein
LDGFIDVGAGTMDGMPDPLDRIYQQLWDELFGKQGHMRGHFAAADTPSFRQVAALMTEIQSPVDRGK